MYIPLSYAIKNKNKDHPKNASHTTTQLVNNVNAQESFLNRTSTQLWHIPIAKPMASQKKKRTLMGTTYVKCGASIIYATITYFKG